MPESLGWGFLPFLLTSFSYVAAGNLTQVASGCPR